MTLELLEIMKADIKRCEDAQVSNVGTHRLYKALIAKYNGIFEGFERDIPTSNKFSCGEEYDYRSELNAIKEKLEVLLVTIKEKDPLFDFKAMYERDLELLSKAISDSKNIEMTEPSKLHLYKEVTAKYHAYIPKLGEGLYAYYPASGFYDNVSEEALWHNLNQVYNKMLSFRAVGYPSLNEKISQKAPMVQITNTNEARVDVNISFDDVRNTVKNMSTLSVTEIDEIQKNINELENIINSSERKTKKWDRAKSIVKWIADKGVDVGIALLPLLLKIK